MTEQKQRRYRATGTHPYQPPFSLSPSRAHLWLSPCLSHACTLFCFFLLPNFPPQSSSSPSSPLLSPSFVFFPPNLESVPSFLHFISLPIFLPLTSSFLSLLAHSLRTLHICPYSFLFLLPSSSSSSLSFHVTLFSFLLLLSSQRRALVNSLTPSPLLSRETRVLRPVQFPEGVAFRFFWIDLHRPRDFLPATLGRKIERSHVGRFFFEVELSRGWPASSSSPSCQEFIRDTSSIPDLVNLCRSVFADPK